MRQEHGQCRTEGRVGLGFSSIGFNFMRLDPGFWCSSKDTRWSPHAFKGMKPPNTLRNQKHTLLFILKYITEAFHLSTALVEKNHVGEMEIQAYPHAARRFNFSSVFCKWILSLLGANLKILCMLTSVQQAFPRKDSAHWK